jgi:hypothetical protein
MRPLECARPAPRDSYRVRPLTKTRVQSFASGATSTISARSVSESVAHSKTWAVAHYRVNFLMANVRNRVTLIRILVFAQVAVNGKRKRASNLESALVLILQVPK